MLGLKQDGAGMLETGRGSGRTAQHGNGPAEAKWVVGCGFVCQRAGLRPRVKVRRLQ